MASILNKLQRSLFKLGIPFIQAWRSYCNTVDFVICVRFVSFIFTHM